MAINTPNINLHKEDMQNEETLTHTFNIDTMLNENWDKIDNAVGDLQTELKTNINQQTTTLTNANPTQHITAKQNCGVDVEVGGEMVVNLLGELGTLKNDSDSDGIADGLTATRIINMSSTDGVQSIEASTENGEHITQLTITTPLTIGHDYFYRISAKAPKGKVRLAAYNKKSDGSYEFISVYGNYNTTNYEDLGVILTPTSINSVPNSLFRVNIVNEAGSTQYVGNGENIQFKELMYIDLTTMLETITDPTTLLAKYPYTNSAQPLLNPTVEVCGKNMHISNNIEQGHRDVSTGVKADSTIRIRTRRLIRVKPNTQYTIKLNNTSHDGKTLRCQNIQEFSGEEVGFIQPNWINDSSGTITTSSTTNFIGITYMYADDSNILPSALLNTDIQLEQGTTPTPYEPYQGGQIIFPTELAKIDTYQDKLTYKDGKCEVDRKVKHVMLDGNMQITGSTNLVGFKRVVFSPILDVANSSVSYACIKYDGKKLLPWQVIEVADSMWFYTNGEGFYLTVSDTDSGWGEDYIPSVDEIKAYFNGWYMFECGANANVVVSTTYNGTGNKAWAKLYCGVGTKGTEIPVVVATGTTTLPISINDQGYTPYQLYYALKEPIQEEIQPIIIGDGVNLVEGQNTLTIKSGYILEKANVAIGMGGNSDYRTINVIGYTNGYDRDSNLLYKVNNIFKVFKNTLLNNIIDDTSNWSISVSSYSYGKCVTYTTVDKFDPQATYYVLYEVLKEDYNCQVQKTTITYEDNIREALNEAVEEVHNIQSNVSELQLTNMDTNIKGNGERIESGKATLVYYNESYLDATISFSRAFAKIPKVVYSISGGNSGVHKIGVIYNEHNSTTTTTLSFKAKAKSDSTFISSDIAELTYFAIGK